MCHEVRRSIEVGLRDESLSPMRTSSILLCRTLGDIVMVATVAASGYRISGNEKRHAV